MTDPPIHFLGHASILQRFRDCHARGRLGSSYLFVGPPGVGKKTLALRMAQGLLCDRASSPVDPCHSCGPCHQVAAGSHPDVAVVTRPAERAFIPLEVLIGDRDHRSGEGFCHWVALTPQSGRHKVGIIDDADYLNLEGANSLLKTLEEPPPRSLLILIATSEQRQLPTIRSRCQIIRFGGLGEEDLIELLLAHGHCTDRADAATAARRGEGSFERALQACDPAWTEMQLHVWQALDALPASRWDLVDQIQRYTDAAGTESSHKRRAVKLVLNWSIQFWRMKLRMSQGTPDWGTPDWGTPDWGDRQLLELAGTQTDAAMADRAAFRLERTLDALVQVDSNVMLPAFIDAWIDAVAR